MICKKTGGEWYPPAAINQRTAALMNLPENRGLGNRFLFASAFQRPRTTPPSAPFQRGPCASVFESTKPPEGKRINEQTNEWRERGFRPFSFSFAGSSLAGRTTTEMIEQFARGKFAVSKPSFAAGTVFRIDKRTLRTFARKGC